MPSEEDAPALLASVSFPGVMAAATSASEKFSDHIYMWALPAHEIFDCYQRGRKLDTAVYESLLTQPDAGSSKIDHVQEPLPIG